MLAGNCWQIVVGDDRIEQHLAWLPSDHILGNTVFYWDLAVAEGNKDDHITHRWQILPFGRCSEIGKWRAYRRDHGP